MKAQSYGKYDVFDDETATTWQEAEALALKARGLKAPEAEKTPRRAPAEKPRPAPKVEDRPAEPSAALQKLLGSTGPEYSEERAILNRALILLIHLRERVFKESPEVEKWVNEILSAAKAE